MRYVRIVPNGMERQNHLAKEVRDSWLGPINDLESVSINKTAARLVAGRSTA